MNINDTYAQSFTINFNGKNTIKGIKADGIQKTDGSHASAAQGTANGNKTSAQATCSKLFEFNMKYGNGNNDKTTVNIDGQTVWTGGRMVRHAIDTQNDKYTDGYKDNAFTVIPNGPGSFEVTCDYCGYKEISTGGLYNDIGLTRTVNVTQNSNSVHEDAEHLHVHFVMNMISYQNGKRYSGQKKDFYDYLKYLQEIADLFGTYIIRVKDDSSGQNTSPFAANGRLRPLGKR